jgi:hypothetical protein
MHHSTRVIFIVCGVALIGLGVLLMVVVAVYGFSSGDVEAIIFLSVPFGMISGGSFLVSAYRHHHHHHHHSREL